MDDDTTDAAWNHQQQEEQQQREREVRHHALRAELQQMIADSDARIKNLDKIFRESHEHQ